MVERHRNAASVAIDAMSVERAGRRVLEDVSLAVEPGEVLGVAGPSGSGKTTLLLCVLGLVPPSSGTVKLAGVVVSSGARLIVPPEERGAGVVFQDLALFPHLSVRKNLEFGLRARGVPQQERERRVSDALVTVGLPDHTNRYASDLSGGEQQRVALARALVTEPSLLVLDEPLTNLDIVRRGEILELLKNLLASRSMTTLYVGHDPDELATLADRVAIIEAGRVVQLGSFEALRASPATDFVRAFSARRNGDSARGG